MKIYTYHKKIKVFLFLNIIGFVLTIFSGCWGKIELRELGIIVAAGIDIEEDNSVRLTVISVEPTGQMDAGSAQMSQAWIGTATGPTLSDAFNKLNRVSSKNLVWFQNKLIFFGEDAVKFGVHNFISFFNKSRQLRFDSFVFVTEGSALELLQVTSDIEEDLSQEILGILGNLDIWPGAYVPNLKEFLVSFSEKPFDNVAGRIKIEETEQNLVSSNLLEFSLRESHNETKKFVSVSGLTLLDSSGHFIGYLNEEETIGYNLLVDNPVTFIITTDNKKIPLSTFTKCINQEISTSIDKDTVTIDIKYIMDVRISEIFSESTINESENLKFIEKSIQDKMLELVTNTIDKCQKEYEADIFEFGKIIMRKHPEFWDKNKDNWTEVFANANINFDINVYIKSLGESYNY